jgi:photosynthetic reaction center cytochrome c subunit
MKRNFGTRLHGAVVFILTICAAALFCASSRLWAQSGAAQSASADKPAALPSQATPETTAKTAAEAYKNIQVLKDIRADQLIPSMRYITVALGVRCDYCHVQDHFDSDDKPEKGRAREMMKMLMAINADNFHNRREVTCFTCHAGHSRPMSIPVINSPSELAATGAAPNSQPAAGAGENHEAAEPGVSEAPTTPMPSVDEILAKYTQALGGAEALQKMSSRSENGTVEIPARNIHATMEVFRKAPDKALATLHTPAGDIVEGFDGTTGWESRGNRGAREETGDELIRVHEWAAFIPGLDLKTQYSRPMVAGIEKINGHDAYRVLAFRKGGSRERLYFDTQSGLLVQLDTLLDSPLGSLPQETDFEDYRDVSGVKIPFTIRVSRVDNTTIYKWDHVEANVAIDDSRFAMPAAAPAPAKP